MRNVFHKMDTNKSGDISVDEFSVFIKEKRTKVIDRIFVIGSPDEDAEEDEVVQLTFGEFLKAMGQFCMFGPPEVRIPPLLLFVHGMDGAPCFAPAVAHPLFHSTVFSFLCSALRHR